MVRTMVGIAIIDRTETPDSRASEIAPRRVDRGNIREGGRTGLPAARRARPTERATAAGAASPVPTARIYRPAPSVMQSGRATAKSWVLEFEPMFAPTIDPLMGWTGSRDALQQVRLTFPTKEQAIAFAERQGWAYTVSEPRPPKIRPKSYADNFR